MFAMRLKETYSPEMPMSIVFGGAACWGDRNRDRGCSGGAEHLPPGAMRFRSADCIPLVSPFEATAAVAGSIIQTGKKSRKEKENQALT
jgi:hypothetical protein